MASEARSGRKPPWLLIFAIIGWSLVIVVGSGPSADDSLLGVRGLDDVVTAVLLIAALAGLVAVVFLSPFTKTFSPPPGKKRARGGLIAFIILAILLWKPSLLDFLRDLQIATPDGRDGAASEEDPVVGATEVLVERDTVAQATDVLLLLLVLVVLAALWLLIRWRFRPEPAIEDAGDTSALAPTELAAAVDEASLVLNAEDDLRRAVIKAYAILEATLAKYGTARALSETPREHLGRSLSRFRVDPTPLLELADLYELARFAERPVTTADRERAARLLGDAQRELRLAADVAEGEVRG